MPFSAPSSVQNGLIQAAWKDPGYVLVAISVMSGTCSLGKMGTGCPPPRLLVVLTRPGVWSSLRSPTGGRDGPIRCHNARKSKLHTPLTSNPGRDISACERGAVWGAFGRYMSYDTNFFFVNNMKMFKIMAKMKSYFTPDVPLIVDVTMAWQSPALGGFNLPSDPLWSPIGRKSR